MTPPVVQTIRYISHGRVQGVGYRWFVTQCARQLGVKGQVRNLPDGTVETIAAGTPDALDAFLLELKKGPPAARVQRVDSMPTEENRHFTIFEVVY
ncbi:MAG: acylphosphatase [Calditrichaeota bacterium]|nr:MAG: acylphosphatase [Calditrichota bacterium]